MKSKAQQNLERLNLYGLVQGLSYVVRLDDLKTAQHLRARLAWVLRQPSGRAKRLHAELKQLFAISGVWVRNVGDRHDTKRQILQIIRRIIPRLKVPRTEFLKPAPNDYLQRVETWYAPSQFSNVNCLRYAGVGRRAINPLNQRRMASLRRKYFRTNFPSRPASGLLQTWHVISRLSVSGPAFNFDDLIKRITVRACEWIECNAKVVRLKPIDLYFIIRAIAPVGLAPA